MKKIITILALLTLVSCAKTIEQKQEAWGKCAQAAVKKVNDKYDKLGQAKGQEAFLEDFCSFHRMPKDQCASAIVMSNLEGTWPKVVEDYTYSAVIKPECGDYPVEDKKSKNK